MISVKNLVKSYGDNEPAVKGVSFEIGKGEIVGLLGPNGAGKTTIMKIITSYMNPTSGEVLIDGKNIIEDSLYTRSLIGYLPENSPQYEDMTIYEYLYFTAEVRGLKKEEMPQAISKMVELTDLYSVVSKKIGELSKGFKKRVGLASVMIHDPQILILDEPTAGLDPNQIIEIRELIKELGREKTVLLSSHILSEVQATCSRVIIINKGNIVADGLTEDLLKGMGDLDKFFIRLKTNDSIENIRKVFDISGSALSISDGNFKEISLSLPKKDGNEEIVYEKIKSTDWMLYEFRKEEQSLEQLFKELTKGE